MIITSIIMWLILSVVFAFLLSISARFIDRDSAEFGACFKASLLAVGVNILLSWSGMESYGWAVDMGVSLLVWGVAISMFLGLSLIRSLVVALILAILQIVIGFLVLLILASVAPS